ncbi:toxin VasX [Pseudomonas sp. R5(2019)]|uniref:toxin VasX n=1 Tax=Pseudomonas sp. R5(2019) TaxID=2697566 RepID=UPI0014131D78|nr:toxin VasX [Pseudomonas sp. R5(2019)]NBA94911.1 hypothetical protein [Pseudomonas sp. R5(2019)]
MSQPFKKALQPASPSEKPRRSAISPPPCQRCIPVYPVRYAVTDTPYNADLFDQLTVQGYPTLQAGKTYGLRVLRPGTYLYLFYWSNARMHTLHYQVTDDLRFAPIWWTEADTRDETPGRFARPDTTGAKPYLLAPETHVANTIHLMVSETLLTHARLFDIAEDRNGIRKSLATTLMPADGPKQTHAFDALHLATATPELVSKSSQYAWSEIELADHRVGYQSIISGMKMALPPSSDEANLVHPLAVALHDPIGTTSELAHLTAVAAAQRQTYEIDHNHAYTSATLIKQYLASLQERTEPEFQQKRSKLVRYHDTDHASSINGNVIPFLLAYESKVKALQNILDRCVADLDRWVRTANSLGKGWSHGLLGKALACYDPRSRENCRHYEEVIARCTGGLTHSEAGRKTISDLVLAHPADSPLWAALANGVPELHTHFAAPDALKSALDIGVAAFAPLYQFNLNYAATAHSDTLVSLMLPLLADKALSDSQADTIVRRLRLFAEIRVGSTIVTYRVSSAEARFQYAQFSGAQTMTAEQLKKWGITVKRPLRNLPATVTLFEEIPRGAGKEYISPAQAGEAQKYSLEGNVFQRALQRLQGSKGYAAVQRGLVTAEYAMTGLAALAAAMSVRASLRDIAQGKVTTGNKIEGVSYVLNALAAIAAVLSATSYFKADIVQIRALAQGHALNSVRTRPEVFFARVKATKLGALGASFGSFSDMVRAVQASEGGQNSEAAKMFMASAGCGLIVTTGLLLNAVGATLGFTGPVGWLILAALATVGVIYFSIQAAAAKFQPDEVWLSHSFWSRGETRYRFKSMEEELAAFHGAIYGVRVVAEWERPDSEVPSSFNNLDKRLSVLAYGLRQGVYAFKQEIQAQGVGVLSLSLALPGYLENLPPDAVPRFQHTLRVFRGSKELVAIEGPIATSPNYRFSYDDQCIVTRSDYSKNETRLLTWRINMRADAQVHLDYCYRPHPEEQPTLALMPQKAPLVFTRGTWITDPIDSDMLEPVMEPKR